jgi:hypothetical protein
MNDGEAAEGSSMANGAMSPRSQPNKKSGKDTKGVNNESSVMTNNSNDNHSKQYPILTTLEAGKRVSQR